METIIIILLLLSAISFSLQLQFFKVRWITALYLAVISVFIYNIYPLAIEQSYTSLREMFSDVEMMNNFVVLLVIESTLGVVLSMLMIKDHFNEPINRFFRWFVYFPGITIFPAIFYLESLIFLQGFDIEFSSLAIVLCISIPTVIWLLGRAVKSIIPEVDLKLELKFVLHILQLIGGVVISIVVLKLPVNRVEGEYLTIDQIIPIVLFSIFFILVGMVVRGLKIKRLSKKLNR